MMASDKDILGKADALLRRHTGVGSDTGAVPVLTDLIDDTPNEDTETLAREVCASVLAEMEARLAVDLEKRIAEQLEPGMRAAIAAAITDFREELAAAIGAAVTAALERRAGK